MPKQPSQRGPAGVLDECLLHLNDEDSPSILA